MKYRYLITEYLTRSVVVDADDEKSARDKIDDAYCNMGEIVLDSSDYCASEITFQEECSENEQADIC